MNTWLTEGMDILRAMVGRPDNDGHLALLLGVGVLVFLLMMGIMGAATNNKNASLGANIVVLLVGAATMLAAAVAVRIYVFGKDPVSSTALWSSAGAAAAALVILVSPLMGLLQRTKYLTALVSVIISVSVAALAIVGGRAILGGLKGGKSVAERVEKRNEVMRGELSEP